MGDWAEIPVELELDQELQDLQTSFSMVLERQGKKK